MGRKKNVIVNQEAVEGVEIEVVEAVKAVKTTSNVDVKALEAALSKNDLAAMQEAVADVKGDKLTMEAVAAVLEARGTGIAAQYVEQIIQRNNG